MSSMLRIKSLMNSFIGSEEKIATFIMNNIDSVYRLTASELADKTDTSPASIIRFSKKVGYSGFKELKISLAEESLENNINKNEIYQAITVNDSTSSIIEKVALESMKAIKDTVKLIDVDSIELAVEAIRNANIINLFGVGSSSLVAEDFQYKLVRLKKQANLYKDHHLQLVSASNMYENDVAIAISHSGKTRETFAALEAAKKAGAKTISITRFGENPISQIADIKLYTTEVEKHLRMGAISSRIAQLTVIDILFINLIKQDYEAVTEYVTKTGNMINDLKIQS
ncbi:MAG: MurR/RpiR family transcriptional regulator [Clostridium sp.]|uniref:MurR/RpiR family transcriptional regulator n=1 Tax=Clostridium sp. TaxID=1506 RepID=UPI003D6D4650